MKSKIRIMAMVLFALMVFCVSCDSADTISTEKTDQSLEQSFEHDVADKKTLQFGAFQDAGNDPNNFVMSKHSLAFDEEYIYCTDYMDRKLYRISRDGTGRTLMSSSSVEAGFLNVYNGYIYYVLDGAYGSPYVKVVRMDARTFESKVIYEKTGVDWDDNFHASSMYVTNGYLLLAVYDDVDEPFTEVLSINLETLHQCVLLSIGEEREVEFSSDNSGNVYVFIDSSDDIYDKGKQIFRIDTSKIESAGNEAAEVVVDLFESGAYTLSYVFAPNGFCNRFVDHQTYYYDEIDETSKSLNASQDDIPEVNGKYSSLTRARNYRFVLGNSMIVVASDVHATHKDVLGDLKTGFPVYLCKDMDVNASVEIARLPNCYANSDRNSWGVYQNKLYYIEQADEGGSMLWVFDEAGNVTKTEIK